jgi:hypothetical protein
MLASLPRSILTWRGRRSRGRRRGARRRVEQPDVRREDQVEVVARGEVVEHRPAHRVPGRGAGPVVRVVQHRGPPVAERGGRSQPHAPHQVELAVAHHGRPTRAGVPGLQDAPEAAGAGGEEEVEVPQAGVVDAVVPAGPVEGVDELRAGHPEAAQDEAVALRQHEGVAGREPGAVGAQHGLLAPPRPAGEPGRPQDFEDEAAATRVKGGQALGEPELRRGPGENQDFMLGEEAQQLAGDGQAVQEVVVLRVVEEADPHAGSRRGLALMGKVVQRRRRLGDVAVAHLPPAAAAARPAAAPDAVARATRRRGEADQDPCLPHPGSAAGRARGTPGAKVEVTRHGLLLKPSQSRRAPPDGERRPAPRTRVRGAEWAFGRAASCATPQPSLCTPEAAGFRGTPAPHKARFESVGRIACGNPMLFTLISLSRPCNQFG